MPVGPGLGLLRFFGFARAAEAGWVFSLSAMVGSSLLDSQYARKVAVQDNSTNLLRLRAFVFAGLGRRC